MPWDDDLGALRAWAHAARPVFICGHERSGTSALLLALARHPALFAVPDVHETFVFNRARELLADPPHRMQQSYLGGAASLAGLRETLARLGAGSAGGLDDDDLVRAFFAHAAHRVYPGRRPLEKTPVHVLSLPHLFRLFPQARVLACVREPVAIADSYRRRLAHEQALGKAREALRWLDLDIAQLIARMRSVDRALRQSTAFAPGRVFLVPYDWLTADPRAALAALCDFIGEPFDAALLAPGAGRRRRRVDQRLSLPISAAAAAPLALSPAEQARLRRETPGLTARWRVPGLVPAESTASSEPTAPTARPIEPT